MLGTRIDLNMTPAWACPFCRNQTSVRDEKCIKCNATVNMGFKLVVFEHLV